MRFPDLRPKLYRILQLWPWLLLVATVFAGAKIVQMDYIVRQKFEGKRWRLPSLVYARPLEFYVDAPLEPEELELELNELAYIKSSKAEQPGEYTEREGTYTIVRRSFEFWEGGESPVRIRVKLDGKKVVKVEQDNAEVAISRLEPMKIGGIYPTQKEDRKLVQLKQVPPILIDALLAIEDREFYDHWGVSIKGISRAMVHNIRAGRMVQGGSTLTQQLVKNFYLSSERSLKRKVNEAIYSLLLELHYSKEEILETYINEIYLGQSGDNAIHGFGLASEFYFGRPLESLSLDQAALLAAMVNGPSHFNPIRYPERVTRRRDRVLELLLEQKKITAEAYETARKTKVKVRPNSNWRLNRFPAYLDLVRRSLQRDYEDKDLVEEGLRIFTAFDPIVQWQSEKAIGEFVKSQGKGARQLQLASVVVSKTGEVQSLIGNKVPSYQGFNRALDARRSIGSLAKPAVLLAALNDPSRYTLASMISDDPIQVPLGPGQIWEPKNFDFGSHGQVSLLTMLTQSYNQATVRLGVEIGLKKVRDTFKKLSGMEEIPSIPSIFLGSLGMTPFEVAGMYYTIFSGGYRTDLKAIRGVQTRDGKPLKSYATKVQKVYDTNVMHLLHYAMRAVIFEGTGRSAFVYLPLDMHAAGKTGTTNDQRDSWFAGFTGDKLAVAWVGNDQHNPTHLTGSSGGLAVWAKIMARVSHKSLELNPPPSIRYQWVDNASGMLSSANCLGVRYLPFINKSQPRELAPCILPEPMPAPPATTSGTEGRAFDWLFKFIQ